MHLCNQLKEVVGIAVVVVDEQRPELHTERVQQALVGAKIRVQTRALQTPFVVLLMDVVEQWINARRMLLCISQSLRHGTDCAHARLTCVGLHRAQI